MFEHYGVRCEFGVPGVHEGALPPGTVVQLSTNADLVLSMLLSNVKTQT